MLGRRSSDLECSCRSNGAANSDDDPGFWGFYSPRARRRLIRSEILLPTRSPAAGESLRCPRAGVLPESRSRWRERALRDLDAVRSFQKRFEATSGTEDSAATKLHDGRWTSTFTAGPSGCGGRDPTRRSCGDAAWRWCRPPTCGIATRRPVSDRATDRERDVSLSQRYVRERRYRFDSVHDVHLCRNAMTSGFSEARERTTTGWSGP